MGGGVPGGVIDKEDLREAYRLLVESAAREYVAGQDPKQFATLLEFLHGRELSAIVEIGTYHGGTTWVLAQIASDDAVVVSVDDYSYGPSPLLRPDQVQRASQRIYYVVGDSHAAATFATVTERLGGRPVDLLLIDGDHTYEGARADWKAYSPLVRPGGVVAFHDILDWSGTAEVAVWRLWAELKASYRTREFVAPGTAGIGVVEI